MAEEFSLGEALGLQTGLPPQGDLGISRGIQTSINADLRRQMMEAQMGNRRQMMQQRMQQMMNRSAQKKFYAPSVARRVS